MLSKLKGIRWQKSTIVTAALILTMTIGSFITTAHINDMEEKRSFDRLYEEVTSLSDEIMLHAENDKAQLEMLAGIISRYAKPDSAELWELLDTYSTIGMMSRIEILLPDNSVLVSGGRRINANGLLSFSDAAALGQHITNREADVIDPDKYIVRHYAPIVKNGETIAMLYGVIDIGSLPKSIASKPYGGEAAIYVIEGGSGDFLVDTWHNDSGGNIWALGERPMAPGYNHEELKRSLTDGETGYVVFRSETTGKNLYFCFAPMGVNDWRMALSVPEDTVFASANAIKNILNIFLVFEALCFIIYFIWMIRYILLETNRKQRQLNLLNYVYDVEKLLFNAHEQRENIPLALEKIARITAAEKISFWMIGLNEELSFSWSPSAFDYSGKKSVIYRLLAYFQSGRDVFEAYDSATIQSVSPPNLPNPAKSILAVPVADMDGAIRGILLALNLRNKRTDPALLKSVCFSFGMLCHNMRSYDAMKEQGERDALTGLYNRNRYETDLSAYLTAYRKSLCCIYIDLNGLHELNNTRGHDAGDHALKSVAEQIKTSFGDENSYRTGGDEFLIFIADMPVSELHRRSRDFQNALDAKDIYVSIGIQYETKVTSMEALIKEAEKKMYAAKKEFYERKESDLRQRSSKRHEMFA
ncbi:MAG TPA: diguanylate cyclase [Firmicutes bacterium]|nr:diguanylate cyclase [Bacillota bacterium]